jgi:hypothetical protein
MKKEKSHRSLLFLGLLPFSLLLSSVTWHFMITNRLYVCSDPVPFLSFLPPWVHSQVPQDHYILHPIFLFFIWILFVALGFYLPILIANKLTKRK